MRKGGIICADQQVSLRERIPTFIILILQRQRETERDRERGVGVGGGGGKDTINYHIENYSRSILTIINRSLFESFELSTANAYTQSFREQE